MKRVTAVFAVTFVVLMMLGNMAGIPARDKPKEAARRTSRVEIVPEIPGTRRNTDLVFLEHADMLFRNEGDDYMVLVGQVEFSKGGMRMYTDSAHYFDQTGSFEAFGNVRMEQGDTLFIYGDELNYDGQKDIAYLFGYDGKKVRLINRDVKLETDIFTYDLLNDLGYYQTGGVLTDRDNRLESQYGQYIPSTKEAVFNYNVILTSKRPNDQLRLTNEALYYNTATHIAEFDVPTLITSKDGRINSDAGVYNTETGVAELYEHSLVTTARGSTLEGDTLFYDRNSGVGEAWGRMALVDTAKQSILMGDYGFYNELIDSAFVTGHAVAMEFSNGDTLYVHGRYLRSVARVDTLSRVVGVDTIFVSVVPDTITTVELGDMPSDTVDTLAFREPSFRLEERYEQYLDTTHTISAWPRVRIYRTDIQGICDSLVFTQTDSMVRMYHHPIVWSEDRQIFGNIIMLHVNDTTVESATLPDFGFMAQHIEDQFYNQLTGKTMQTWFENGQLHRLLVEGNAEGIVYPEENDSTINKLVNFQTSNLDGYFQDQVMQRMKMWPQTSGEAIPLYLAKYTDLTLPKFKWYTGLRPLTPADIYRIPPEMDELMSDIPLSQTYRIPPAPNAAQPLASDPTPSASPDPPAGLNTSDLSTPADNSSPADISENSE